MSEQKKDPLGNYLADMKKFREELIIFSGEQLLEVRKMIVNERTSEKDNFHQYMHLDRIFTMVIRELDKRQHGDWQ
jgi:hypothetical protein